MASVMSVKERDRNNSCLSLVTWVLNLGVAFLALVLMSQPEVETSF